MRTRGLPAPSRARDLVADDARCSIRPLERFPRSSPEPDETESAEYDPADSHIRSALAVQRQGSCMLGPIPTDGASRVSLEAQNDTYRAFIATTGSGGDVRRPPPPICMARGLRRVARSAARHSNLAQGFLVDQRRRADDRRIARGAGHARPWRMHPHGAPASCRCGSRRQVNLHEFAFGTTSEESAFGAARNPARSHRDRRAVRAAGPRSPRRACRSRRSARIPADRIRHPSRGVRNRRIEARTGRNLVRRRRAAQPDARSRRSAGEDRG